MPGRGKLPSRVEVLRLLPDRDHRADRVEEVGEHDREDRQRRRERRRAPRRTRSRTARPWRSPARASDRGRQVGDVRAEARPPPNARFATSATAVEATMPMSSAPRHAPRHEPAGEEEVSDEEDDREPGQAAERALRHRAAGVRRLPRRSRRLEADDGEEQADADPDRPLHESSAPRGPPPAGVRSPRGAVMTSPSVTMTPIACG